MQSDKYLKVVTLLSDLNSGEKTIGDSVHMMDELVEAKQFYADFFGDDSVQYKLSKGMHGLISTIDRSIRFQKECQKQTLAAWVIKIPSRSAQLNLLLKLVESE